MEDSVSVQNLSMIYRVPVRETGFRAAMSGLFRRTYREITAVSGVSFALRPGEITGFIGPNGAGKTTTIKMLSGILHPTAGAASVLGFQPWLRKREMLRQIALIRGSQPLAGPTELTVMDALRMQQLIYAVPEQSFRGHLDHLAAMLSLEPLLDRQIRALSLGERMRCGIANALIYAPRVIFLDEPTIGLDVSVVEMLRAFILDYCRETGATVLLTSHAMADIERLCQRVMLIDHGTLAYDGALATLSLRYSPLKEIAIRLREPARIDWSCWGEVVKADDSTVRLRVMRDDVPRVAGELLSRFAIDDLAITEMPLEQVIDRVYREGVA
jgi:ABC-2 type transport system ATP-binding protein